MVDKSLGAGYITKKEIKELYIIYTYHYKEFKKKKQYHNPYYPSKIGQHFRTHFHYFHVVSFNNI